MDPPSPQEKMSRMLTGYWISQALYRMVQPRLKGFKNLGLGVRYHMEGDGAIG